MKLSFWNIKVNFICKKSLKIPKGQSESVYRRRTDNTMAKGKSTKGQTTIYKTQGSMTAKQMSSHQKLFGDHHHWGKAAVRNLSYVQPNMDGDSGKF